MQESLKTTKTAHNSVVRVISNSAKKTQTIQTAAQKTKPGGYPWALLRIARAAELYCGTDR